MFNRNSSKRGFTLVEILVVLVIIGILAALLFPVFLRVREDGRKTTCQSNLKQIGVAIRQYVQDNDGIYPAAFGMGTSSWIEKVQPYAKNSQIFVCPSQIQNLTPSSNYDYNIWRLNTILIAPKTNVTTFKGKQESILPIEASIIILEDTTSPLSAHQELDLPSGCEVISSLGYIVGFSGSTIHSDGGNYAFADGHVKWLTPEGRIAVECEAGSYS